MSGEPHETHVSSSLFLFPMFVGKTGRYLHGVQDFSFIIWLFKDSPGKDLQITVSKCK